MKTTKYIMLFIVLLLSVNTQAAKILFAHVNTGVYVNDGNNLASFLTNAGHNVETRFLHTSIYSDWSSFDQIFVYDLSATADNSAIQMSNYMGIASWYNTLAKQNLILDGRIISSSDQWTSLANGGPSEEQWIQNYAAQLDARQGGLVLGTDHAPAYTQGINEINKLIGLNEFSGFFYEDPFEAQVDTNSPLFVNSLGRCISDNTKYCINDNSSTSFVATGMQTNGQLLTPVAYHGTTSDAFDVAAVSTTMGSKTFDTCGGQGQPPCVVSAPTFGIAGIGSMGILLLSLRRFKQLANQK